MGRRGQRLPDGERLPDGDAFGQVSRAGSRQRITLLGASGGSSDEPRDARAQSFPLPRGAGFRSLIHSFIHSTTFIESIPWVHTKAC